MKAKQGGRADEGQEAGGRDMSRGGEAGDDDDACHRSLEFIHTREGGGQGDNGRCIIVPQSVQQQQWEVEEVHAHLLVPTPLIPMVSSMGGRVCNPHTAPFPFLYPPNCWEGLLTAGVVCNSHATPCLILFTPTLGGFFFPVSLMMTGVTCNPHVTPF